MDERDEEKAREGEVIREEDLTEEDRLDERIEQLDAPARPKLRPQPPKEAGHPDGPAAA